MGKKYRQAKRDMKSRIPALIGRGGVRFVRAVRQEKIDMDRLAYGMLKLARLQMEQEGAERSKESKPPA